MTVYSHHNDLPQDLDLGSLIAIDTETMGLNHHRDRLCVVQLCAGDGDAHLVHFPCASYDHSPILKSLLESKDIIKIFHFARFDVAVLYRYLNVMCQSVYCTKIASKLVRTYTNRHGLKDLCRELLGVEISKEDQCSDWGAPSLTPAQCHYAAGDVLYLHEIKQKLDNLLEREGRLNYAKACFDFISCRAMLDLEGWNNVDIFSH